jgi:hypothetical protein
MAARPATRQTRRSDEAFEAAMLDLADAEAGEVEGLEYDWRQDAWVQSWCFTQPTRAKRPCRKVRQARADRKKARKAARVRADAMRYRPWRTRWLGRRAYRVYSW